MELIDFIRIKRNVEMIIDIELSGQPQIQVQEYIGMLETELINQSVEAPSNWKDIVVKDKNKKWCGGEISDPAPIEFGIPIDSYVHKSSQYTRKDLEMECDQYFERYNLDLEMEKLDPIEYSDQMRKANNRLKFRKQQRKKLKLK